MATQKFKHFLRSIILITMVLAIVSFVVDWFLPIEYRTKTWPFLLVFFLLTNSFLFFLYLRIHERKVTAFANFFMLSTSAKLLFYLIVIVIWLYFNRYDTIPFVITFFIYYMVYTVYEVKAIMKMQFKKSKQ